MTAVLFVCLGNICRSPLAEGIFQSLVNQAGLSDQFTIDSAGTGNWHIGDPPDPRSIEIARRNGLDISHQHARQVEPADFKRFDIICAMDASNLSTLKARAPTGTSTNLRLFLNSPGQDVPDPYFGGEDGFAQVYRMLENGALTLLKTCTAQPGSATKGS